MDGLEAAVLSPPKQAQCLRSRSNLRPRVLHVCTLGALQGLTINAHQVWCICFNHQAISGYGRQQGRKLGTPTLRTVVIDLHSHTHSSQGPCPRSQTWYHASFGFWVPADALGISQIGAKQKPMQQLTYRLTPTCSSCTPATHSDSDTIIQARSTSQPPLQPLQPLTHPPHNKAVLLKTSVLELSGHTETTQLLSTPLPPPFPHLPCPQGPDFNNSPIL